MRSRRPRRSGSPLRSRRRRRSACSTTCGGSSSTTRAWIGLAFELLAFVPVPQRVDCCLPARGVAARHPAGAMGAHYAAQRLVHGDRGSAARAVGGVDVPLAVVSLSWLFFVAIPVVLMLAVLVHGGAVTGSWWRSTLSARSLAWVLVAFVALSVFGSIMTTCPVWARVPSRCSRGSRTPGCGCVLSRRCCTAGGCRRVSRRPSRIAVVLVLVVGGTARASALSKSRRCVWSLRLKRPRNGPIVGDRRDAARRRHRLQHQVGRPCRSVRARPSTAMAFLVPGHDGRRAAAVYP